MKPVRIRVIAKHFYKELAQAYLTDVARNIVLHGRRKQHVGQKGMDARFFAGEVFAEFKICDVTLYRLCGTM